RPRRSAAAYRQIWTTEGSPLVVTGRRVRGGLQQRLGILVELAMRYQNPSAESALRALDRAGLDEVLVIPLFPQYAMSSFETAVEHVRETKRRVAPQLQLRTIDPYFDHAGYIDALETNAREHLRP